MLETPNILQISHNTYILPCLPSASVQQQFCIMFETTAGLAAAAAAVKGLFCLQASDLIQPHVSVMAFSR